MISLRSERDKFALEANFAREKLDRFMKEFEHQVISTDPIPSLFLFSSSHRTIYLAIIVADLSIVTFIPAFTYTYSVANMSER